MKKIKIVGAREHNLKNINLELPREKLIVIVGISGSGKSTLAFDTIYAEGQRRYVESLSAYARQFLGVMEKPDVDYIEGLSPAISIDQKTTSKNPRSTVGTVTEIYDYMRLLFARIGTPFCPKCDIPIQKQTPSQITDQILEKAKKAEQKIVILAPVITGQKGEHKEVFERLKKAGFARARVDGTIYEIDEVPHLERYKIHTIEAVVDRLILHPKIERARIADSVETALDLGDGVMIIQNVETGEEQI